MANPYTQGLRYNYKPLDLSTIGKAAVMKQGQYDQTQSALDEFDVSINALSQQEDWARGEESKYREKIDALSDGLAQSKDPRASMRQLAKLNKEYKRRTGSGGDIAIVEGNVATMQDFRKRHQKMIADGKNVPANFNTFLSMQMEGFKGFDDEGKLQSLGLQDMTANKSTEMTDRAIELGKMTKADQKMQLGKYASVGGFRKEAIDIKIDELNNAEKAVYIQQVLANSAEFKPYLDQERSLINYRNKGFDGETYMGNQLGTLDKNTEALEAQLAGKGLNENQKTSIQNNLNAIKEKRKELSQGIDKFGAMQYGQMLKSNAEYHNLTALPAGTANLMNHKKTTLTRSGFTDEAAKMAKSHANAMDRDKAKYVRENGYGLLQTPGGTNPAFTGQTSMEINNEIKHLTASGKNPVKLRQLEIHRDIATKKSDAVFIKKNHLEMERLGVSPEDLKSGKVAADKGANMQQLLSKYSNGAPTDQGYTVDAKGNVYASIKRSGGGGYSSTGAPSYTADTYSKKLVGTIPKNELGEINAAKTRGADIQKLTKNYSTEKDTYFKEGNVTANERYVPTTAKAGKTASDNFKLAMDYNEFNKSGLSQTEFAKIKNDENFIITGLLHDPQLGTVTVKGTSGKEATPFTLTPNYAQKDVPGEAFGGTMNNLMRNYTSTSGESGAQLSETVYGDIKYVDIVPMYESSINGYDNITTHEGFNTSSKEINTLGLPAKYTDKFALQTIEDENGATGTVPVAKYGNAYYRDGELTQEYRYSVTDNRTGLKVNITSAELKDVSTTGNTLYRAGSKTDAINDIIAIPTLKQ